MKKERETAEYSEKKPAGKLDKTFTVIGIVLCVILVPILIGNIILIIDSYVHKDKVPSLFNLASPMIVLTDSMDPTIKSGDLIVVKNVDAEKLVEGDIIAFFDPASDGVSVVTHRIKEIVPLEGGQVEFITKGDNNNTEDDAHVPAENLVGLYKFRIPKLGNVAIFMQSTPGLIICVALPIILLVGYDFLRRRSYEKAKARDTEALLRELEELKSKRNADDVADNTDDNA